ncbi:hypothetical protein KEM48_003254 [Puccinia striiformis f. sp. tritici PST-130]|nr:hypothetical protein KEM48_003254 [Puccinia striiformis f. sp. tritici PST-130]
MAHYAAIRAAASWLVGYVLDGNQHTFVVQSATKGEAEPAYQVSSFRKLTIKNWRLSEPGRQLQPPSNTTRAGKYGRLSISDPMFTSLVRIGSRAPEER